MIVRMLDEKLLFGDFVMKDRVLFYINIRKF